MTSPPNCPEGITMASEEMEQLVRREYKDGFVTDIESDTLPPGLDENTIAFISKKKGEPEWMLEWRLDAYRQWLKMEAPSWAHLDYPPIDYQSISYFSAPKRPEDRPQSLDEVDPKLLETYEKLGIPLHERAALAGVAVDAVFDSVSVATTFKKAAGRSGRYFLLDFGSYSRLPGADQAVLGHRGARGGQLLCRTELCGVYRWLLCVCAGRRDLPHGVVHLFPH
ncbi:hypothetical protein HORIV_42560 [Vreelandella olivaria]|uniref:Fe-S cluster assembly protein SufB n=1 Tax=Vreelandella olivaria TaxID=390919 RepID=A0ABM8HL86_9GAMM|nr:hypothetical protein HORIV_42560 [Halomonas olivaria]